MKAIVAENTRCIYIGKALVVLCLLGITDIMQGILSGMGDYLENICKVLNDSEDVSVVSSDHAISEKMDPAEICCF